MARENVPILQILRPHTERTFRAKLRREGKCIVFTGSRNPRGYGIVELTYANKTVRFPILAHRLAWVLANRQEIPADRIICHRCNNPNCCNPRHLYLGTHQDNSDDMMRGGCQSRAKPLLGRKGEAHPAAKYSDLQRMAAIELRRTGMRPAIIEAQIGVPRRTIAVWWSAYTAEISNR